MYCPLCQKIIEIRKKQEKGYFIDLCNVCQDIYIKEELKPEKILKKVVF